MSEWVVVEVLVVLIGVAATVSAPVIKLTSTLTELNTTVKDIKNDFDRMTANNTNSHRLMWAKLEKHDGGLLEHEGRIERLEEMVDAHHGK